MSNSPLVTYTRITKNKTSPRNQKIDTITIHCIVGQWTAKQGCDYFATTDRQCSANYVVGKDGSIGLSVEEKDRSWCSSSASNDNRAITIECASDSYEPYAINDKVYKSLIKLCVDICKRNGIKKLMWKADKSLIGQVDKQNMTVHRWFNSGKSCPGEYIYSRLGKIANEVNAQLGAKNTTTAASKKSNTEIAKEVIRGSWGNGVERKQRLTAAGYNYTAVQAEVDRMLGKKKSTVSKPAKISKGDRVKIKQGATFSDGTEPYQFVYTTTFDVIAMSKDGKEALIGIGTDVTGWMYVKDLKAE